MALGIYRRKIKLRKRASRPRFDGTSNEGTFSRCNCSAVWTFFDAAVSLVGRRFSGTIPFLMPLAIAVATSVVTPNLGDKNGIEYLQELQSTVELGLDIKNFNAGRVVFDS
ncbi:MAG: hypothetical protein AAGA50_07600 [Pseudomonadota bacterium]